MKACIEACMGFGWMKCTHIDATHIYDGRYTSWYATFGGVLLCRDMFVNGSHAFSGLWGPSMAQREDPSALLAPAPGIVFDFGGAERSVKLKHLRRCETLKWGDDEVWTRAPRLPMGGARDQSVPRGQRCRPGLCHKQR